MQKAAVGGTTILAGGFEFQEDLMHTIRLVMIPVGLALLASSNLAPALAQTAVKQFDDASS